MVSNISADPESQPASSAEPVSAELHHEIEQFLYYEARLLDERRFEEWYELLADDLQYVMPTRYNRLRREAQHEFAGADEAQHFDEDKHSIAQRIRRLRSGTAWAEDPPSRTRHFVSNVVARRSARPEELEVDCYYLLYRSRLDAKSRSLPECGKIWCAAAQQRPHGRSRVGALSSTRL